MRSSSSAAFIRNVIMALKKYDRAEPARMSVAGVMWILRARMMIAAAGTIAPMKALTTIPYPPADAKDTPTTMDATAPRHAPDDIPVLYGSARGLFIMDCMSDPAAARPHPATIAPNIIGMALFQM